MSAPTASRLAFLPTRRTPSQWFPLAALFLSSSGASLLTATSASSEPSLLKSPTAMPRAANGREKTGPLCALIFSKLLPV